MTRDKDTFLAANIKQFRKSVGISQKELAKVANVTQANVSQWESGSSTPPIKVIQLIKDLYPKVNAEWFFTPPNPAKNFFEDKTMMQLKQCMQEKDKFQSEVVSYRKLTKSLNEEIDRLRDQLDVMTSMVKKKLK